MLALLKVGVPWVVALEMPEAEAVAWLDAYRELREPPTKTKTYKVRRKGKRHG